MRDELERSHLTKGLTNHAYKAGPKPEDYKGDDSV